jgi:hypothetical protein
MKIFPCLVLAFTACQDVTAVAPDGGDADMHVLHCGEDTCNASPQPTCIDGDTLRSYDGVICDGERCAYLSHELECGVLGCCGDHCCTLWPVVSRGDER